MSYFILTLSIPSVVQVDDQSLSREDFYEWLWGQLEVDGMTGVHEGTVLFSQDDESIDSAEVLSHRDFFAEQAISKVTVYFSNHSGAEQGAQKIKDRTSLTPSAVQEQPDLDWNAEWNQSFLSCGEGVVIPPFWRVVPPWVGDDLLKTGEKVIRINPGSAFGVGTHETTQLCLRALGEFSQYVFLEKESVLDFGSGSGILAIGAAILGAIVDAVEIDDLAIDNALENASLNQVHISFSKTLDDCKEKKYRVVLANILRPVLEVFAVPLVSHLLPTNSMLILSGLIEDDLPKTMSIYTPLLGCEPILYSLNAWRCLVYKT